MLILDPVPDLHIVGAPRTMPTPAPIEVRLGSLFDAALHPRVLAALREISRQLGQAGVRHAVLGALAVGVYGWPRATQDVDLLVGGEAWERLPTGELRPRIPLPESIDGVGIDYLPIDIGGDFLEAALDHPVTTEGIPIAPPEVVICTKLLRLVMRDQADIVEMVKAGLIDRESVGRYLARHTPMLVSRWEALVLQADAERRRAR